MPRGIRGRLVVTVIALVVLTSAVLGVGAYLYVAESLRAQELQAARDLTGYNVGVLAAERLPATPTRDDLVASRLLEGFAARGIAGTIVDFGDGNPYLSGFPALGAYELLSSQLRSIVAEGQIAYERISIGGQPFLVTGARRPAGGPDFYFLFDASDVESAITRLGQALLAGGLLLAAVAALAARSLARRLLEPVATAAAASERMASGDLSTRLAVDSDDEFGTWATSFNRMAASLEDTIAELQAAQDRERRFVADVSHELRTPLTALVAEASLLRAQLDGLPPDERRVGELLVADVARLRGLVDDLMEISRFDSAAEDVRPEPLELRGFLAAVAAARAPDARLSLPDRPDVLVADWRRVERIVGNLLDNARVHGDGHEVEIAARIYGGSDGVSPDHEELSIVVADHGPGVEEAELPRLFERFHKADPSRHRGGSGLGLAIAREHATLIGGSLVARLREGGGLAFELRIPVTRPLPDGDRPVTEEVEPVRQLEAHTESRT